MSRRKTQRVPGRLPAELKRRLGYKLIVCLKPLMTRKQVARQLHIKYNQVRYIEERALYKIYYAITKHKQTAGFNA